MADFMMNIIFKAWLEAYDRGDDIMACKLYAELETRMDESDQVPDWTEEEKYRFELYDPQRSLNDQ